MAGREVREYTNLSDPKDKKWGKGKDKIDDEDVTFQRMVAKIQSIDVAILRQLICHISSTQKLGLEDLGLFYRVDDASRCKRLLEKEEATFMDEAFELAALDSDDLLYLKEQMEAEEDAERLLRRTEKRAFAAFKKAASLADSSPASAPLPLRVEPKPKSGIRQQDLLKKVVEIKPKRPRVSSPSNGNRSTSSHSASLDLKSDTKNKDTEQPLPKSDNAEGETKVENPVKSLLGLAYASSDDED